MCNNARMSANQTLSTAAADELARTLGREIDGDVRFDPGVRAMYSYDASHYRQAPIGYVAPRDVEALEHALAVCRRFDAPILMRGGGTSLAGQGCNHAVVFDFSRYLNRVLEIDPDKRTAKVQPGVVLDALQAAARPHGLCFGPDPSTHAWCTLGGMIGNNACGVHSVMAGKTVENVEAMTVLTCDGLRLEVGPTDENTLDGLCSRPDRTGETYRQLRKLRDEYAALIRQRYPKIPRQVSGYNLDELLPERGFHLARALVGTEGTCVVMADATVRLVHSPPHRVVVVLGYGDVGAAGDAVPRLLEYGPVGLEGMARSIIDNMRAKGLEADGVKLLPPGEAWLFVEFGGDTAEEAADRARRLTADLKDHAGQMVVLDDPAQAQYIWRAREAGLGASGRLADGRDTEEGWEDAAVDPGVLGDYLREFTKLLDKHELYATQYGHFGQGLVHNRIDFRLDEADGVARYRAFVEDAADLVVRYGGSLSGEHGDGQSRAELLDRMFGHELIEAFAKFKAIWDPHNHMNPGKVVAPRKLDEDLKLGPGYKLPQVETRFAYPADDRQFARAVSRCVGVGKCRRAEGGTMCPSYMVTGREEYTTRGRARLLYEMLHGRLPDGWANEQVHESLELCLACKGCKSDCPAGVDIATYKAEFLWHYHQQRRRPLHHYAFGFIHRWAALGSIVPAAGNAMTRPMRPLIDRVVGLAPQRMLPRLANRTFTKWFGQHERRTYPTDRPRVILWPDEFNDYFEPDVLRAGLDVLEHAGYDVRLPAARVVSGRAMYDMGLLDAAKKLLARAIDVLREEIEAGTPIVGLEPSCVVVFRDEMVNLLPDDVMAQRLSEQTFTLAELLSATDSYEAPQTLSGDAVFHGHCHQKSTMGTDPDVALLRATGLNLDTPETGCCGMAGSFGFRAENYEVSQAVGERVLLPAVREASDDTLIITDGFSCREQVDQATDRRPLHLAQVLAKAHRLHDEQCS